MIHMKKAHKAAAVVLFVLWAAVAVWHYQTRTKPELAQREAAERLSNAETDASDFLLARGETDFGRVSCYLRPTGVYTCRSVTDGWATMLTCHARLQVWHPVSGARCRVQP